MKIAVTGGNGRIGTATIALALAQGHTVVNIDRVPSQSHTEGVTNVQVETTDYEALQKVIDGCDALIHLAAIIAPGRQPDHVVHNNNVVSSYNALRAAAEVGIKHVCQASSINAIGGYYSRWPHYDYFPLDEQHPTYNEDAYSLSKWICERQADSIACRYDDMAIASLRIHGVVQQRADIAVWSKEKLDIAAKHLWGYVRRDATARACLLAISAEFTGHEAFYIVAPDTAIETPSLELHKRYFPEVSLIDKLTGNQGFFNCQKAERLLGWQHDNL